MASAPGIPNIPVNLISFLQITRANLPLVSLFQGEVLTLGVVEKLPDKQYLMNVKGMDILGRSDAPLMQGARLQVQVVSTEPHLLLQVMDVSSKAGDAKTTGNIIQKEVESKILIQVLSKPPSSSAAQQATGQTKLQLTVGQALTVTVGEKLDGNQYKLLVKDVSITATSDIPLKEGDKLQVKVQSLQPQILLGLTDAQKQATDLKINERLIQWRINPESMMQLFGKSSEFVQNLKTIPLPSGFSEKDAAILMKVLGNMVLSPKTKSNPIFVKEFVEKTGLMMERDLSLLAAKAPAEGGKPPDENLKALMMKLSDALGRTLQESAKIDSFMNAKLQNMASFTTDAVKILETGQAVNSVYQNNENGLYLQIPIALGDAYRQAEIFIRPDDKNAPASKRYSSCSVNIFLDLDYLGEIAIVAGIQEGRIRCIIKCENDETRQLLDGSAMQLQEALAAIGYGVGKIECVKASDLAGQKAEFIGANVLGATDLVNSYA